MHLTSKITDSLRRNSALIVLLLCLIQPFMDVLSFWLSKAEVSNTVTLMLRLAALAFMVVTGYMISGRRKVYIAAATVSILVGLGHVYACIDAGYGAPAQDLTNYVRVLLMPWTVIALISYLRCGDEVYTSLKKGLTAALFVILAVEVAAQLTGTEPHTYMDGVGYIGWFNNTNSQSAILDILVPVAVTWLYIQKGFKSPLFWVALVGGFTAMFFLGTRLCFFGIAATGLGIALSMFIIRRSDFKRALVFVLVTAVFLGCFSFSPMMEHQRLYLANQEKRQNGIDDAAEEYGLLPLDEEGISDEEYERRRAVWIEFLTPIYTFYSPAFVEMFGAEKTIEMFDYSRNINSITETRPLKLKFASLLMDDSPASARFFGLELGRFTVNGENYDVENDLHGIYYLYGAVGLFVMLAFLLYFVGLIAWALIKDPKKYFTLDAVGIGIALVLCLIHVYNTAGVLRRPNASFYLAVILASVYYLVYIKKYPSKESEE